MKRYLYLSVSIVTEIIATMFLKLSEGFTVLAPSIIVVIGYGLAFYSLGKTLAYLPLSLAYAIWSGVGTAITAILGVLIFEDPLSIGVVFGIILIIGRVVLLNTSSKTKAEN
ncbi:QacE family quaternary ammonium compound efflux SMR transporter [Oceanobacillus arenosus]|uniref:QacE family quaternary ammonium compound efflux SMR transporter n=1 Tax=Oceanobacillus arenosus TaxID=1229153 RepID=A0A3D8PLH7_9BACI|nr:multidrug efflux SMR transporter [Oceanobacillus arenosus]RDW16091.1 QacE family quaternary ammonium compound efflux SMR transporter [Oceanobacillus arenosus]